MAVAHSIEFHLNSWLQLHLSFSAGGIRSNTVYLVTGAIIALWLLLAGWSVCAVRRAVQRQYRPTILRFLELSAIALVSLLLFRSTILFRQDQFSIGLAGWFIVPSLAAALAVAVLLKHKIDGVKAAIG